jgi:hypothetical protein
MSVWGVVASTATGIAIGVAGTVVVWLFKARVLKPDLRMSEQISRREEGGKTCWRVKLGNYSRQNAIDLSIRAVLRARGVQGTDGTTVLAIGLSSDAMDVLPRRAKRHEGRHRLVYIDPANLTPFGIDRLPEELRKKVQHPDQHGRIELEELLGLGNEARLTVTVFCFNELSGTRKWFSEEYTAEKILPRLFENGSLKLASTKSLMMLVSSLLFAETSASAAVGTLTPMVGSLSGR